MMISTHGAYKVLIEKLNGSRYGTPDSLDHIAKKFDESTKRLFRDKKESQFIPFGSPLDKDISVGIRGGQLKLTGYATSASSTIQVPHVLQTRSGRPL
jgi:hypothetical protein